MDFFGRYIRFNEIDKVAVKLKKDGNISRTSQRAGAEQGDGFCG